MNQITLTGNVGKDPEIKCTKEGKFITNFTLADSRGKDDQKETIWHNIVCFDEMAENIADQVTKGQRLIVQGRLSVRKYTDKQGQEKVWQEIVADEIGVSMRWGRKDSVSNMDRTLTKVAQSFDATEEDPF